jgi:hypothetical protein
VEPVTGAAAAERLKVSKAVFLLTTECLHLRSNEMERLETLEGLVVARISAFRTDEVDGASLRHHLATMPTGGEILLEFSLPPGAPDALTAIRVTLSKLIGATLSTAETVSALLFTYLVEKRAAEALALLMNQPGHGQPGGKVVRFP